MFISVFVCLSVSLSLTAVSLHPLQVTITYRFGREEDEVMGVHFSKELQLMCKEIPLKNDMKTTEMQERLVQKLGAGACPFFVEIPDNAPCSVQLFSDNTVRQPRSSPY